MHTLSYAYFKNHIRNVSLLKSVGNSQKSVYFALTGADRKRTAYTATLGSSHSCNTFEVTRPECRAVYATYRRPASRHIVNTSALPVFGWNVHPHWPPVRDVIKFGSTALLCIVDDRLKTRRCFTSSVSFLPSMILRRTCSQSPADGNEARARRRASARFTNDMNYYSLAAIAQRISCPARAHAELPQCLRSVHSTRSRLPVSGTCKCELVLSVPSEQRT